MSIPGAVIDGYATIMAERSGARGSQRWGGAAGPRVRAERVGALAAAVSARYGATACPVLASVEPDDAACTSKSLTAGGIVIVPGPHRSIMAGLNCGRRWMDAHEPVIAGTFGLQAITVDDDRAHAAMRLLAGAGIVSGESGASGLAGLLALATAADCAEPRERFGIGAGSSVLVFSTEGATDPEAYTRIVEG